MSLTRNCIYSKTFIFQLICCNCGYAKNWHLIMEGIFQSMFFAHEIKDVKSSSGLNYVIIIAKAVLVIIQSSLFFKLMTPAMLE